MIRKILARLYLLQFIKIMPSTNRIIAIIIINTLIRLLLICFFYNFCTFSLCLFFKVSFLSFFISFFFSDIKTDPFVIYFYSYIISFILHNCNNFKPFIIKTFREFFSNNKQIQKRDAVQRPFYLLIHISHYLFVLVCDLLFGS